MKPGQLDTKTTHRGIMHLQGFSMLGLSLYWFIAAIPPMWAGFVFLLLSFGSWEDSRLWILKFLAGALDLAERAAKIFKSVKGS
jgi:hypothetical protein